jgi:hypothetical protein
LTQPGADAVASGNKLLVSVKQLNGVMGMQSARRVTRINGLIYTGGQSGQQ